jgi:hypothetical protein
MGSGRAWAALRYDEGREVNKKKIHRLWREEGLQVKVVSPRKRAGVSSVPPIIADAPKVVWAIDFQFDSNTDGKAIKIASLIDEHTREPLLNIVERSITGEDLVDELEKVFATANGPPKVLRLDNGPEMISQALQQFCDGKAGLSDYGRLGMWADPASAKRVAVWAFVMVLACSRHLFVRPVIRMDQTTWCACHVEAFESSAEYRLGWRATTSKPGWTAPTCMTPRSTAPMLSWRFTTGVWSTPPGPSNPRTTRWPRRSMGCTKPS